MKSKILLLSILPLILSSMEGNAATSPEGCDAVLKLGLYNVTQSSNAKDAEYNTLATFCAADYSSSNISEAESTQIEASYGMFSGGGGRAGSRQEIITKQSQVCTLGFNSSKYREQASAYSKTVYQGSLDAWNRCQEIANNSKGMIFDVYPSSTMQGINVQITAPAGYTATFYGVTQQGQGRSLCTVMANGKVTAITRTKPFKFTAASKVTVDCARKMIKTGEVISADAQDLTFITSAKNLVLPLAAIGSFSRVTADQIYSKIEEVNTSLKTQLGGLSNNVEKLNGSFPVSCSGPVWVYTVNANGGYSEDIYKCTINTSTSGVLTLGLNGHVTGISCRYTIFVDGKDHYWQSSYSTFSQWESVYAQSSDTIAPGDHVISVRVSTGSNDIKTQCSIAGTTIGGLFTPHI